MREKVVNRKLWILTVIATIFGVGGAAHVLAQTNQPLGHWQLIVTNAGDGGNAWKFNPDTGQSYFCYRQNCFAQVTMQAPAKQ
jgi:hypothetical protein